MSDAGRRAAMLSFRRAETSMVPARPSTALVFGQAYSAYKAHLRRWL